MSYIHPAAVEHLRKRWTRPDAYRFAPPGSPEPKMPGHLHSWAAVARAEEVKADAERAEQDAFERELLALRHELAKIRLDYELRRFQQKYSPDQPRVPAGNSDGGQWTDGEGSGAGGDGGQVLSDVTPDGVIPGAQYAENAPQRQYSVILADEEAPNGIGHTIRDHIGKSDEELLDIARRDWARYSVGRFEITEFRLAHGSFLSLESANDFVNRTLENDQSKVDRVANGQEKEATLDRRFGYPTGREVFRPTGDSDPYMRDTYGVRVVIRNDPRSENGYRVLTAFPINEDSKR
jgi:Bacterial CdiA-CT RNAse A domain